MLRLRHLFIPVTASAVVALAVSSPVYAQGNSQHNKKSRPPSSSPLPGSASGPAAGASPLAWLDDASLLTPGTMSLTVSAMRWSGTDVNEVDAPNVDVAVGLAPRLQLGASVPHVVGSPDGTGPVGGVGTSYISAKIALMKGASGIKLAVAPMVEILGEGAVQALGPGQSRTQIGLPLSMELSQGPARVFASTGVFSRGAWFAGGGVGWQATPRTGISTSFTRSWARDDSTTGASRDRRELSGSVSYFLNDQVGIFGSIGRTIATTDENGAGTSISGGISWLLNPPFTK